MDHDLGIGVNGIDTGAVLVEKAEKVSQKSGIAKGEYAVATWLLSGVTSFRNQIHLSEGDFLCVEKTLSISLDDGVAGNAQFLRLLVGSDHVVTVEKKPDLPRTADGCCIGFQCGLEDGAESGCALFRDIRKLAAAWGSGRDAIGSQ
ncbi:MAG: hypothetical protein H7833_06210 [Magnetococcus sp. DMHC-1]